MAVLGVIIKAILEVLFSWAAQPKRIDVAPSDVQEREWSNQANRQWAALLLLAAACLSLGGCFGARVVVVPYGKPVLLAEDLENVRVFTKDADGTLVEGRADLPAGWIVAPLKDTDDDHP